MICVGRSGSGKTATGRADGKSREKSKALRPNFNYEILATISLRDVDSTTTKSFPTMFAAAFFARKLLPESYPWLLTLMMTRSINLMPPVAVDPRPRECIRSRFESSKQRLENSTPKI